MQTISAYDLRRTWSRVASSPDFVLISVSRQGPDDLISISIVVEMNLSGPWPETDINTKSGDGARSRVYLNY